MHPITVDLGLHHNRQSFHLNNCVRCRTVHAKKGEKRSGKYSVFQCIIQYIHTNIIERHIQLNIYCLIHFLYAEK